MIFFKAVGSNIESRLYTQSTTYSRFGDQESISSGIFYKYFVFLVQNQVNFIFFELKIMHLVLFAVKVLYFVFVALQNPKLDLITTPSNSLLRKYWRDPLHSLPLDLS